MVANLRREGIPEGRIRLVGDVMYDAALFYGARADERSCVLERLGLAPKSYILGTTQAIFEARFHYSMTY